MRGLFLTDFKINLAYIVQVTTVFVVQLKKLF